MGQNLSPTCKKIQIWSKGFKVTSQKADFERDYIRLHSCHIVKKVGKKGYIWPYMGPFWRKLAEVG